MIQTPTLSSGPIRRTATHTQAGKTDPELILSITCGCFLALGFTLSFFHRVPAMIPVGCYICAYLSGGWYASIEAYRHLRRRQFDIDFLMLVAAAGAATLDKWSEGALLLFLFSLGNALEQIAMDKARKTIRALTEITPDTALIKKQGGLTEVPVDKLAVGDLIVVRPGTKIAADGIVVLGSSSVNQAPITGESMPVDKTAFTGPLADNTNADTLDRRFLVFAGTINGNGTLEIKVTRKNEDSTLARLVKMVTEAQQQKSPTQQFADKVEKYYVPAVLVLISLLCLAFLVIDEPFSKSFYRAMAVLIGASPCALAISTPSAVLSGVARAARAGVLVKGGRPLEDLGTLHAMAFDKTGTLTEGKPRLTAVAPSPGISENELLSVAVAVESLSDHPLAKAVVEDGTQRLGNASIPPASALQAVLGKGVRAQLGPDTIYAGNLAMFEKLDEHIPPPPVVATVHGLEEQGNTTMLIRKNTLYLGAIALMDSPRKEAYQAIKDLAKAGIRRMVMLTGDNQKVADAVAHQVGITEARGGLLPEQKVEAIASIAGQETRVAMVGDGVNDAPAMVKSTVGIAMGAAGSDVALETADVALLGDRLDLLPFAIGLSRKARSIIRQNLFISLGMVALLIPLTILGITGIGPAVIGHEGSTVVVVLNALRLLAYNADGQQ
jgi:Cd2+/Zn2+-exporting ATPase